MSLISKLLHFVIITSQKYGIDDSHSLKHSMDVLHFTHNIYESEVKHNSILANQDRIVYISAIIHDMCDKKYMNEKRGIREIGDFLEKEMGIEKRREDPEFDVLKDNEITAIKQIISTMSYSTVKKNGFPFLGPYQNAYHIVREADLLAAYDFDRCLTYHMNMRGSNIHVAFDDALELFENRVLKHNDHGLFLSSYAKTHSEILHIQAVDRMNTWRNILQKPRLL